MDTTWQGLAHKAMAQKPSLSKVMESSLSNVMDSGHKRLNRKGKGRAN